MQLTIFTPTYNRCSLLERLYQSLLVQHDLEFEWLIVDDGSSDNTEEWIKNLPTTPFELRYFKTENKGKHIAINKGVKEAKGEWFFIVDSDDYLTRDAILKLKRLIIKTPENFAGFCTNRIYEDGSLNGNSIRYNILDTDFITYRTYFKYTGEKPSCLKTAIWKEFPFPEYDGEKFCGEALVLRRIAKKYKVRYFNVSVYVMEGYLEDGLTHSLKKHFRNSPTYAALMFREKLNLTQLTIKDRLITLYNYWEYYKLSSKHIEETQPNFMIKIIGLPAYYLCKFIKRLIK